MASETTKLLNLFWETRYMGGPYRQYYVSLQQFGVKALDVIHSDTLFTDAHYKANFRLQLGEYVPTRNALDMAMNGPPEGNSFFARSSRLRNAIISTEISPEFTSRYPEMKEFWMAVYTGTMEGRLKDALVAWADAQLIHEASKDTSGCKFIFDFDSVLTYLEDNEGLVRAIDARTKQAKSDARQSGTPGHHGAAATSDDPSGMAAADVKVMNSLLMRTNQAIKAQGKTRELAKERSAADTARLELKGDFTEANFRVFSSFILENNMDTKAYSSLCEIAKNHGLTVTHPQSAKGGGRGAYST